MKQSIKHLLGGAVLFALPLTLTSCEDILGEWSKPAPVNVIVTPDDGGGTTDTSNQYYKWDGTQLAAEDIPAGAIEITDATTELSGGVYIVKGDITLSAIMLKVTGDSELILCDGTELKVNGPIEDSNSPTLYKLSIYGQKNNTGKLTVTADGAHGLWVKDLDIHGGDINITVNPTYALSGINVDNNINIYGGKVVATADMAGIENISGLALSQFKIFGGDVTAIGRNAASGGWGIQGENITISGASTKLTATGGDAPASSGAPGGHGIEGVLTVDGGTLVATGGQGDGTGKGGAGINGGATFNGGTITAIATKNLAILANNSNITVKTGINSLKMTETTQSDAAAKQLNCWLDREWSTETFTFGTTDVTTDIVNGTTTITDGASIDNYQNSGFDINRSGTSIIITPVAP